MWLSAILFSFFLTLTFCEEKKDTDMGPIVRARLEVKAFIRMLLPHYHDVNIMYIPGKDPAMVFLNAKNKVVLEEDVSEKSKEEI
ncbi:unnamed protein product [Porites evermanni]|uniref:Selenoprotein F/M domain-containing protein n=1 Tax=Porites evermanni TaxID=104178 RepID=A0ABN8RHT4_9CNID|nr:unnamed protein product [Porites evermanni]